MARVKLYESDVKKLLFPDQLVLSASTRTTSSQIISVFSSQPLVVKVDQGIKKRGKQGLVAIGVDAVEVVSRIRKWSDLGYTNFIVEPVIEHSAESEIYLSFERTRYGWKVLYSDKGGIEIESAWDSVKSVDPQKYQEIISQLEHYHLAFLELNPVIIVDGKIIALDAAALLDDAALGLIELASLQIIPVPDRVLARSESEVAHLDDSTPASLKFRLINPDGRIWMFLSGGGASLVLADEVADIRLGGELANYGEYSGAPTDDDVYSYSKIILKEICDSKIQKKAIIIAGGVANFTDVGKTFKGLIGALKEYENNLAKGGVKVFVRRGGPNEKKGLDMMEKFLKESNLYGSVHGHQTPLTEVVTEVKEFLS